MKDGPLPHNGAHQFVSLLMEARLGQQQEIDIGYPVCLALGERPNHYPSINRRMGCAMLHHRLQQCALQWRDGSPVLIHHHNGPSDTTRSPACRV